MEDEMDHLATNMATITEFSGSISNTLQDRRQQITKLSGVHTLLKKVRRHAHRRCIVRAVADRRFRSSSFILGNQIYVCVSASGPNTVFSVHIISYDKKNSQTDYLCRFFSNS